MTDAFIPYGRQSISDEDVATVVEVLRSDWLTTGPLVGNFEEAFAAAMGAAEAVAVSNGTAALHCAMHALGIGPGDEVIVPPITFAASSNCVLYCGGTPVFADVEPDTMLLDVDAAAAAITSKTRAILAVDYAGQPCDWDALRALADEHDLALVADGCHAPGATYHGRPVGTLADLTAFSFHPVKHLTTGEGGMITTEREDLAAAMRTFRSHGIQTDHRQRTEQGTWFYEMVDLGFNYRITDFQCALGLSQLRRLEAWVTRRREIAARYHAAFADLPGVTPLVERASRRGAYHLFAVRIAGDRGQVFQRLRDAGIGVNVHYVPVHLHPYYRRVLGTGPGLCPVAEAAYEELLSLPMFPDLTDAQVDRIIASVREAL